MITIALLEPENEGNVGAIARLMHNFGFKDLLLINPKCTWKSSVSIARSKHGKRILDNAKVCETDVLKEYDLIVGTTGRTGTDYNLPRSPLTPKQLADSLPKNGKIVLLFGREGTGLRNEELTLCDFVIHIPTGTKQSTLNLSHAVAIVLYELVNKEAEIEMENRFKPASQKEKDILLNKIDEVLDKMKFPTTEKKETQRKLWKRLVSKSFLTRREAFALFGFFRKLK